MKRLLVGLSVAAMLFTMTACGNGNTGENQIPDNVVTSDSLSDGFRFNTESTYYGYNEKEQSSLGVVGGRFTYINAGEDISVTGTVTESGDLTSETATVTYKTSEGKLEVTLEDETVILDLVGEDQYVTVSQLLMTKIDTSNTQDNEITTDISDDIPDDTTTDITTDTSADTPDEDASVATEPDTDSSVSDESASDTVSSDETLTDDNLFE